MHFLTIKQENERYEIHHKRDSRFFNFTNAAHVLIERHHHFYHEYHVYHSSMYSLAFNYFSLYLHDVKIIPRLYMREILIIDYILTTPFK